MNEHQKCLVANGLLNLANLLAAAFIVGLSVTKKDAAASVPMIGIAAVAGLYATGLVILRNKQGR